jgi:E3 ubiquitin-protein ligase RGLG
MHNPYQKAIVHLIMSTNKLLVESLGSGDGDDGGEFLRVHAFGFGDSITKDTGVFSMFDPGRENSQSNNISDTILSSYTNAVKRIDLSGPSSFAPVIRQTVEIIKKSTNNPCAYKTSATMSILFLLTDGELSSDDGSSMFETMQAIVDASSHALSIVILGVGDGPWTHMLRLDKYLCNKCKFDNLNFVDYSQFMTTAANSRGAYAKCLDNELFCLKLFNKLPHQFRSLRQLNLI